LKRAFPGLEIRGWDPRPPAPGLDTGVGRWAASAEEAFAGADWVILAAPIPAIRDLLPAAAGACRPGAVVTDTGSVKSDICRQAERAFAGREKTGPWFIGGHPMAGSERLGAAASDPDLLREAPYALCAGDTVPEAPRRALEGWVRRLGARPVWVGAAEHDRLVALVSHLPQLAVVALAGVLERETQKDERLAELAGSGLRDLLRLASSPAGLWRDICTANAGAIRPGLEELACALRELGADVDGPSLEAWFERARRFRHERLRGGA
jgi:prephenate dehydrogenase